MKLRLTILLRINLISLFENSNEQLEYGQRKFGSHAAKMESRSEVACRAGIEKDSED